MRSSWRTWCCTNRSSPRSRTVPTGVRTMNWIDLPPVKSVPGARKRALRKFGLVMAAALAVVGGVLAWRGRAAAPYVWGVSVLFVALGLLRPVWLGIIEPAWMKLAEVMGAV